MLTPNDLRKLKDAYTPWTTVTEAEVLEQIGNPSPDEIVASALQTLQSEDRNLRVLALRVLKEQSGEKALRGILAGLNDPKRRVREVAVKSSGNYLNDPAITDRLKAMVADATEKPKIRQQALRALAGGMDPSADVLTESAAEALESLAQMEQHRFAILFGLVTLDLNGHVEDLLKEFVKNGSKDEAVMATRALHGYRVANLGQFESSPSVQRQVMATYEIAAGRVWYWIPRDHYAALLAGQIPES
jgi:HEAT repeat protein